MEPTVQIFIGAPLKGTEAAFLRRLHSDLGSRGRCAILANFEVRRGASTCQIDFVVITPQRSELLELKCWTGAVFGSENGSWQVEDFSGTRSTYPGANPWTQARDAKFALNDAMVEFRKGQPAVPGPSHGRYFSVDASVCIYPQLHAKSKVTTGNYKAWVRGYPETLKALVGRPLGSSWSVDDWCDFATRHLNLTPASLREAIDPAVHAAHRRVEDYLERVTAFVSQLPPALASVNDEFYGDRVLVELLHPKSHILIGRSGLGKTFHLQHLAGRSHLAGEVPLFVEARYYSGDLNRALKKALGPFTDCEPAILLEAIRACGLRSLLLADSINDCRDRLLDDLLKDLLSFQLRYDARIVAASHRPVELPGGLALECHELAPLAVEHKRAIYSFHAGIPNHPDVEPLCEAFSSAFDLKVAGRCHGENRNLSTRAEIYDRYCGKMLPKEFPAVAAHILRSLALRMNRDLTSAIPLIEFERDAANFLSNAQAPLRLIDDLRSCRLLVIHDDSIAFEHGLLQDYYLSEELRRNYPCLAALAQELAKPRNQPLIELLLPRQATPAGIRTLLQAADSDALLLSCLQGRAGPAVGETIREDCERLFDDAVNDLPNVELTFQIVVAEDGRRRVGSPIISGTRPWSDYQRRLCSLIAACLDTAHFQDRYLELLDLTEWTLRQSSDKAAAELLIRKSAAWGEVLRVYGALGYGPLQLPCTGITSAVRTIHSFSLRRRPAFPLYDRLKQRVEREGECDFATAFLLQAMCYVDPTDIDFRVELARRAAKSGIYILMLEAVEVFQSLTAFVMEHRPDLRATVVATLEEMLEPNRIDLLGILVTLSGYDAMEPPVPITEARSEMRAVIDGDSAAEFELISGVESDYSIDDYMADRADGLVGRIFEDVFQGTYYEAYGSLTSDEKARFLSKAAMARRLGLFTTWVLGELLEHGDGSEAHVYRRFASCIDRENVCSQEAVGAFILGVAGWAKVSDQPVAFGGVTGSDDRAWELAGEMLFWLFRTGAEEAAGRIENAWEKLQCEAPLAAPDVFYQLVHAAHCFRRHHDAGTRLLSANPSRTRRMLENGLRNRRDLTSVFQWGGGRDKDLIRFLIRMLGEFGTLSSIDVLKSVCDDRPFGSEAIEAVRKIHRAVA